MGAQMVRVTGRRHTQGHAAKAVEEALRPSITTVWASIRMAKRPIAAFLTSTTCVGLILQDYSSVTCSLVQHTAGHCQTGQFAARSAMEACRLAM